MPVTDVTVAGTAGDDNEYVDYPAIYILLRGIPVWIYSCTCINQVNMYTYIIPGPETFSVADAWFSVVFF